MSGFKKNVASQRWRIFAWDVTTGLPKTGDSANITAKIRKDYGSATPTGTTNPTETESGFYEFPLTQDETNADVMDLIPVSATSNIQVVGVPSRVFTVPQYFSIMDIGVNGRVAIGKWLAQPVTLSATTLLPAVDAKSISDDFVAADSVEANISNLNTTISHVRDDTEDIQAKIGIPVTSDLALEIDAIRTLTNLLGDIQEDIKDRQVVYEEGAVWVDLIEGTPGTTIFVNGTSRNPVISMADANTLATALKFNRFKINNGSSITFVGDQVNKIFDADGAFINMGSQNVNLSVFNRAIMLGIGTGAAIFRDCALVGVTIDTSTAYTSVVSGTTTLSITGTYHFLRCTASGATDPIFNFGAVGAQTLNLRDWSGAVEIQNLAAGDIVHFEGNGLITFNANCTGGTAFLRGNINLVDNSGGAVTLNQDARYELSRILSDETAFNGADIADILTDTTAIEVDTQDIQSRIPAALVSGMMDSNISAIDTNLDAAEKIALSVDSIEVGSAVLGTLSTTQMSTDLTETTNDHYKGRVIIWTSGNLLRQATNITAYNGTSKVLTFTATTEAPANNDDFIIV
jgi:hypothetical protein